MSAGSTALVGRRAEQAALDEALRAARAGRGRLVLVSGEAGMGKSQLAEALAERAAADGVRVAWGRAWESGGAPPYWPWVELLRAVLAGGARAPEGADRPLARLLGELEPEGAARPLGRLMRELDTPAGTTPRVDPARGAGPRRRSPAATTSRLDPAEERFELFDAVARTVEAAAHERPPLVLLLDDMHAADLPSLLLLRFVAPRLRAAPVLLLAAYREGEVRLEPERARIVNELARDAEQLPLRPLDADEAAALVEQHAGTRPPAAAVRALTESTGGNPLFIAESARLLGAGQLAGRPPVPARLRDVIARRAAALPPATAATLEAASVVGRDFAVALLARVLERSPAEVLTALDPAVVAGMAEQRPAGRMRFSHVLLRDALYDELPPSRRAELHHRVGVALEDEGDERLSELAHHFLAGGAADVADRGIDYAARAGDRAMRVLAFEQAVASYELAVEAATAHGRPGGRRCELQLALGAAHWRAGDARSARAAFAAAAELATAERAGELLAGAALGFGAVVVEAGMVDRELVALLEAALAALPATVPDPKLRPALLGRLARELHFAGEPQRRARLADEAVALAREQGDAAVLARALGDWHVAEWRPDNVRPRLEATGEIVRLAEAAGDRELHAQALVWRTADLLEAGDVAGFDEQLDACERVAATLRQPVWAWQVLVLRATRELMRGRFDEAGRLSHEALEHGREARGESASTYFTVQEFARRREVGGIEEIEPILRRNAIREPATWWLVHVWALVEIGQRQEASERFGAQPAQDVDRSGDHLLRVVHLAQAAHVCERLGAKAAAAPLYERLAPYGDRWVVIGIAGGTHGSVQRWLGVLATMLGRLEPAERHLRAALDAHERAGSPPWTARTQLAYAHLFQRRGEVVRAERMLDAAAATGELLGMAPLLARIEEARAPRRPTEVPPATLEREGEYWAFGWGGRVVRVRDSKGVRHLARLLSAPHTDLPARILVAEHDPAERRDVDGLTVRDLGDDHAGEQLDEQARREYRARVAELREELEQARAHNDPERAERLREELELLARELSRAVGLGGRPRVAASAAERARLNATRAIRTAIRRIADQDAALGAHLDAAVRTGSVCSYAPDEPVAWRVNSG